MNVPLIRRWRNRNGNRDVNNDVNNDVNEQNIEREVDGSGHLQRLTYVDLIQRFFIGIVLCLWPTFNYQRFFNVQ